MAKEITTRFHSSSLADEAEQAFDARFKKGEIPEDIESLTLTADKSYPIANALKDAGLTVSTSDAYRMIKQGAVKVNGEKITDKSHVLVKGTAWVVQVGKRKFAKISIA